MLELGKALGNSLFSYTPTERQFELNYGENKISIYITTYQMIQLLASYLIEIFTQITYIEMIISAFFIIVIETRKM